MPNPFNSENAQMNKTGGGGKPLPNRGSPPSTSTPSQSTANWPGLPGKTGPSRGSTKKIKQFPKSIGI